MPVYRRPGERYQQYNIRQTENFGGGLLRVWGGISFHSRTELVLVNKGTMTAARYIADILEPRVVPFGPLNGENFIYMHDNARPHAARVVTEFLQNAEIDRMASQKSRLESHRTCLGQHRLANSAT
ncbi:hypothetical protein HHI36_012903 [Cryptolaemus montrouzieri]|uniref:Transposase n=1 Tax=Cryptolaemus montrouzieri TaxID=559131 RepID=A0ABD2NG73_9CUCU